MKRVRLLEDTKDGRKGEVKFVSASKAARLVEQGKAAYFHRRTRGIETKG